MARAKKPNRAQYYFIGTRGLSPSEWLVKGDTPTQMSLVKRKMNELGEREITILDK